MTLSDAEIYGKHAEELMRFASLVVGPHDAADAVSGGVVAALRSPGWGSVRNHRAYLYQSVLNEARMMLRREARRRRYEERVATREPVVDLATPRPEVLAALRGLSPQQRAVVYLTYWEDLAPVTIGELLSVSEGTVRRHLARARKNLRKVLDA